MFKVKLTFPPGWPIFRQTPGNSGIWGNYKFYLNDNSEDHFDYWVVYDQLITAVESTYIPEGNIMLITAEPEGVRKYSSRFLHQFKYVITCQDQITHPGKFLHQQSQPWFVNRSFDELNTPAPLKKTKKISIITSNKVMTDGHKKRLEFAYAIKDHFKDAIDLYGRGIRDFDDKWDVLAPYRYNICIENTLCNDYFTEKLTDCYLASTFPIYYGCPNLEKYIRPEAFIRIDIANLEQSIQTIGAILEDETHYEQHLPQLNTEKQKSLTEYNLFPMIVQMLEQHHMFQSGIKPGKVTIRKDYRQIAGDLYRKIFTT